MNGAERMGRAKSLAAKLEKKAADLLAPLETEMKIMGWKPEFKSIMWEAVAHRAIYLAKAAAQ